MHGRRRVVHPLRRGAPARGLGRASGATIESAARAVLDEVAECDGVGGLVAVDAFGNVAMPFSTEAHATWRVAAGPSAGRRDSVVVVEFVPLGVDGDDEFGGQAAARKWDAGEAAFGMWAGIPTSFTAELGAVAGYDYVCADLQHGPADEATMISMFQATQGPAPCRWPGWRGTLRS